MPLSNLNNAHLTQAQVTAAQDALTALENALSMLTVTLTASERSTYGSVNEQNKLLINKVWDYIPTKQPQPFLTRFGLGRV